MKKFLIVLFVLIVYSCSSSVYESSYNNPSKIVAQGNSYYYSFRIGQPHKGLSFKSFSGIDTCYNINSTEPIELTFDIDITKGDFKVIALQHDGTYIEITESTSYLFDKGIDRIKIAGIKSKGSITITSDDINLNSYISN